MRAGPVGLWFADPGVRLRVADEQARITHLDLRSRAAALLVADVVADALAQPGALHPVGSRDWCEALAARVEGQDPGLAAGLRTLPRWLAGPPAEAAAEIARAGDVPLGAAHGFEKWHGISPFATPSALYAVYAYAVSPLEAERVLCTAVAVGGDVDTVAAMAGAMVGARVGWSGLGQRLQAWAEALNDQGDWGLALLARLGERTLATRAQ
jgi:ADP-ribosylglycohydrolase